MKRPLRILVADDEPDMREYFRDTLPDLGHEVVAAAANGPDLVRLCRELLPDLVITDIKMPLMDGIDAAVEIFKLSPVPVILVSGFCDDALIERAETDHILAYLVKPIKQADLEPAIAIAIRRFQQFQELAREAKDLREALRDRKLIERAKGILMRQAGIDEQEAFRRMQKMASERNKRLVEIAEILLIAEEAWGR